MPAVAGQRTERLVVTRPAEELDSADGAHKVGEALVELDMPADEQRVMRHLVDHRLHQPDAVLAEHGREERVGQPAQRAEGGGRAQVRIVVLLLQLARLALRRLPAEEALVGHAPDDGEPPGVGGQPIHRAGGEHQRQSVAVDLGEGGVAVADVEPEVAGGEAPGLDHQLQLSPRLQVDRRVVEDVADGAAPREDTRLLPGGAQHVAGRAGEERGAEHDQDGEQGDGQGPESAAPPSPGRGTGVSTPHDPSQRARRRNACSRSALPMRARATASRSHSIERS